MRTKSLKKQLVAQFYRGNMVNLGVAIIAALGGGTLNLIISWILQQLIDAASGAEGSLPLATLAKLSGAFLVLCAAVYLLQFIAKPRYLARAMRQYKDLAFRTLINKNISSFRDESTAAYISALTNDAASVEANYLTQQLSLITKAVTFFGAFIMMLFYSPLMTAIAAALTVLPFIASLLTGGRLEAAERRVSDCNRDFTAALSDCLAGFSVVKSFKAEKEIFELFARSNRALENEKFSRERIVTIVGMIGAITAIFAQLGVFIAGAYFALKGYGLTPGAVILFVNLMNFTIEPIASLPGLLAGRKAALGLVDKLAAALEKNQTAAGTEKLERLSRGIELNGVSFGYEVGKDVLHDVSARFEAGKAYAIVGGSGSGKSTLLNLLMAANTEYSGSITLDGTEIRDIAQESLYDIISVIQQNVFVFNASIKDNVSMFRAFDNAELDDAIRRAHLGELIAERGEDYFCGENGSALSGGEKQRVSIARSLLKKSSVLLADEATAALDAETAHQVACDILDLDGVTRIVVTHALEEAQLRRYDGIIVLKNGRIAEQGSFDALMAQKGYFYALFTVAQ